MITFKWNDSCVGISHNKHKKWNENKHSQASEPEREFTSPAVYVV